MFSRAVSSRDGTDDPTIANPFNAFPAGVSKNQSTPFCHAGGPCGVRSGPPPPTNAPPPIPGTAPVGGAPPIMVRPPPPILIASSMALRPMPPMPPIT